jgi:type IV pilus assembly protein PilC
MPEFQCRVATATGEVSERSFVAADESALRRDLENQDLMILDVRRRSARIQQLARLFRIKSTVSSRDFLLFNQEFSALVRAGLPILSGLDILLERRKNPTFKQALLDIRSRIKSGEQLSEAFAAQGGMFPSLYSASLASGERTGELATVLKRYIAYAQKVQAIRRRVISAMIYPTILLVLASGLILLMIFYIIPTFKTFLDDFGTDLPLITRVIVGIATFCTAHWKILLVVAIGAIVGLLAWRGTAQGRYMLDKLKLGFPLVGTVMQNYAQNRFTRTLGTLQAGGLPLVTSLDLAARAVGNLVFERGLLQVVDRVREGRSLWESLEQTELLTDITIQMIKVGESTGGLVEMLENASDFTDEEIETQLTRLVALVEPLMLVFMAIVVAIMLLSIYLPLVQAYGGEAGI